MQRLKKYLCIFLGNVMITLGIGQVILANGFIAGGVTGFSLVLQHIIPIDITLLTGIINTILFLLGAFLLGKEFALSTALSAVIFPFSLKLCTIFTLFPELSSDYLFASILGGICMGIGIGVIIRSGASTGGIDIISLLAHKYFGVPVAKCLMVVDVVIISLQLIWQHSSNVLYGLLIVFLTSYMVNQTLVYGNTKIQVITVSKKYEQIRDAILYQCNTGVTMLNIETGYEQRVQKALLTIVPYKLLLQVKQVIKDIDPHAFVIISEAREVNGRGYNIEH